MSLRALSSIIAVMATMAIAAPAFAGGNASSWTLNAFGGTYQGSCSLSEAGIPNSCHGKLIAGTAVSTAQIVRSGDCQLVVTPGGRANMNC